MLYVAWADGDLEPEEIRSICSKLTEAQGESTCRDLLGKWLDPDAPPSATSLLRLLRTIRRGASSLSTAEKQSLTELGIELARAGGQEVSQPERLALEEIEAALGIAGSEASRLLLVSERPAASPAESDPGFEPQALQRVLDGDRAEIRQRVRALLSQPEFAYRYGLPRDQHRELVLGWCRKLAAEGFGALSYPEAHGGADDLLGFVAAFETIATHDLSTLVKFGVQFGLFGGSILQLGTARHHQAYLGAVGRLELPGGFAMTETGHGSNVYDLETTAHYDRESEEFVIHTPHHRARKDYIGNAARHGRLMTVFAQLRIDGESYGVHAFLVPVAGRERRNTARCRDRRLR